MQEDLEMSKSGCYTSIVTGNREIFGFLALLNYGCVTNTVKLGTFM